MPGDWAIDRNKNSFLVWVPSIVSSEPYDAKYIFLYAERYYFIVFEMPFYDGVNDRDFIERHLKEDFSAYGRYGLGSKGEKVIPIFDKGEKSSLSSIFRKAWFYVYFMALFVNFLLKNYYFW